MHRSERAIILPVTIGGILEFYEIYLYSYWVHIIKEDFYSISLDLLQSTISGLLFGLVLISRPLGGLIFGYLGDRMGRKFALVLSIAILSLASISVATVNISPFSGIYLIYYIGIIKFIQGIPIGGELPAAICLLSESTYSESRKRYLCSFMYIGPQIGQILSMTQCMFMDSYFSPEFLVEWGWRISFFIAGAIGLSSILLRSTLHESLSFEQMKRKFEILHNPVKEAFKHNKNRMLLAFLISIFEVAGFFMLAFFLVEHFSGVFDIDSKKAGFISALFLIPIIIMQPIIGKISERYGSNPLYYLSAISVILISGPLYLSINYSWHVLSLTLFGFLIISLSIQFALLPSLLADMFPSSVRFTGIGFSLNMCNSFVGTLVPLFGEWITEATGKQGAFLIIYPLSAIVFLVTLPFISSLPKKMSE